MQDLCQITCRGRWGTIDTFLHFRPLLLYFKSKQAQNLSHNKATLYTQYHSKTSKNNALQKKLYNQFKKGTFSVECAPCMVRNRHEHGVHLTGQKKLGCMHCIMFIWYPMWSRHLLTASPLFSPSNYPLSLHGKTNLMITKYSMKPMQYAEIHALPYKYNVPLST